MSNQKDMGKPHSISSQNIKQQTLNSAFVSVEAHLAKTRWTKKKNNVKAIESRHDIWKKKKMSCHDLIFQSEKKKKTGLERTVAAVVQQQIPLKIPYQRYNLSLFTFFCQRRTNDNKAIDSRGLSVWFYTWYSSILFKQLAVAGYCQMYAWRHRQGLEKWSHLWGFPRPETAICVGDMSLVLWVYLLANIDSAVSQAVTAWFFGNSSGVLPVSLRSLGDSWFCLWYDMSCGDIENEPCRFPARPQSCTEYRQNCSSLQHGIAEIHTSLLPVTFLVVKNSK